MNKSSNEQERLGTINIYHVFSHGIDAWLDTFEEADALFNKWAEEFGCARIYEEKSDVNGEEIGEDCIKAVGEFPL